MSERDPVLPEVEEKTLVFGGPERALGETFNLYQILGWSDL